LKAWIQAGKEAPLAPYITEEACKFPIPYSCNVDTIFQLQEKKIQSEALLKGGMAGPVCWYKVMTSGISIDDDKCMSFLYLSFPGTIYHHPA
jgi:soluble epoxide hydrolase/lipid-phosphate phosphatase